MAPQDHEDQYSQQFSRFMRSERKSKYDLNSGSLKKILDDDFYLDIEKTWGLNESEQENFKACHDFCEKKNGCYKKLQQET